MDPLRDIETINLELIFSDMEILERRIAKTNKSLMGNKALAKELDILKALLRSSGGRQPAKSFETEDEDELAFINSPESAHMETSNLCRQCMRRGSLR